MGFDAYESSLSQNQIMFDLSVAGTSRQMWVYKVWLEVQATIWAEQKSFFIFNASEGGISGVLSRSYEADAMKDRDNWYLIDEILPKRWSTTTLARACERVLEAKKCLTQTATDSGVVLAAH